MTELALPLLYAFAGMLFLIEHLFPAHPLKSDVLWYLRAGLINTMVFGVFVLVESVWSNYANSWSLFSLSESFSAPLTAFIAYFIFTFFAYWWHRLRHHSNLIWRVFHQLHHSPKRLQTLTAFYIHPLDMAADLIISNSIIYLLLGLNLEAASWYILMTGTAGFLIHANIRLPRWIGYVFQTPEMHRLHHKSGHHAQNYSDIVWWDMLFGTYCNPSEDVEECGFSEEKEGKTIHMLLTQDLFVLQNPILKQKEK